MEAHTKRATRESGSALNALSVPVSYDSDRVDDGGQIPRLDSPLRLVGSNRTPNRVDLDVQTLNASLEHIEAVDRP